MSANFNITGSADGPIKAVEALNKALDATAKGADGAAVSSKKLQDIAMRIREAADPQEKYNRKLDEMKRALQAGLITQAQFEAGAKKLGEQLKKAGDAGGEAFGPGALRNFGAIASSVTGISSALDLAVDAMRNFRAEQKAAADDALRSRQGIGQLSQLAASDKNPAQAFRNLVAEADAALRSGAASDRGDAASLIFDLAAAGIGKSDRDFAVQMRSSGTLTNVGGLAGSYDALRTAMGANEVGSFREFASKALAAGAASPGSVEQLPVALARAGSAAKSLGISDESLLAAGATLAKEAGSPSEGGTKLAALLGGIQKSGVDVGGMNLAQMLDRLSREKTGYGGVFADNQEAISAFRTLRSNMSEFTSLEADITKAQSAGLADQAIGLPNLDRSQFAANLRAQAEGGLAFVNDQTMSRGENLRQAAMADWSARLRRERPGLSTEANIAMERFATSIPFLGDADRQLSFAAAAEPGSAGAIENPKLLAEIRNYLRETAENTRGTNDKMGAKVATRPE